MEDTFKVRVDRIFGSLNSSSASSTPPSSSLNSSSASSTPPSSSLRSLWCLTDEEIERKEWNRDRGSPEPEFEPERRPNVLRIKEEPSRGIRELENDLDELEDEDLEEDDAEQSSLSNKPEDYNDEEWEIKSLIGRDCTLDYEEEEDVYDKVAVGREKAGDRLYMKDFNDYGIDIDSGSELPSSLGDVNRDPRANHIAAKIRLKEDEEAAGKEGNSSSAANSWVQPPGDDANVKSILKRKDGQTDSKSRKRVRFDSTCTEKSPAKADDIEMETEEGVVTRQVPVPVPSRDFSSAVPDYIRNPSRYTHYTFESSSDMDEQSNRQAYMDFLNILKRSKNVEDEAPADLPKSVTFVPRKKRNEAASAGDDADGNRDKEGFGAEVPGHRRGFPVVIAVGDDQESEACAMEEDDETESAVNVGSGFKRAGRQYRVKAAAEVEE